MNEYKKWAPDLAAWADEVAPDCCPGLEAAFIRGVPLLSDDAWERCGVAVRTASLMLAMECIPDEDEWGVRSACESALAWLRTGSREEDARAVACSAESAIRSAWGSSLILEVGRPRSQAATDARVGEAVARAARAAVLDSVVLAACAAVDALWARQCVASCEAREPLEDDAALKLALAQVALESQRSLEVGARRIIGVIQTVIEVECINQEEPHVLH